jgi:hypothetical protein
MTATISAEYVLITAGGALMPVTNPAIASAYVQRGVATLHTRKTTMTPDPNSGTAHWTYGPWKHIRSTTTRTAA